MTVSAAERASILRARSRARVARFRQGPDAGLAEGGVALGPVMPIQQRDLDAEEDYLRFRGLLYSAVRPIADTVAGQAVRVATVRTRGKGKGRSIRRVRPVEGMTSAVWGDTNDGRSVLLPAHLKAQAPELDIHETHRALELIEDPNPVMTDWHLKYLTAVNLILTGVGYWWHTKSAAASRRKLNGQVLWPLPTSWVAPDHDKEPFGGWLIYPGGGITSVDAGPEDVIMIHVPDPSNLFGAKSAAHAQRRAIRTDEQMQTTQEAIFQGIFPRWGVIIGDPAAEEGDDGDVPLMPNEMRLLVETAIAQKFAGAIKANTPVVLDALVRDVKRLSSTVEEMDFVDSGQVTYERITQGIGANPFVMGKQEPASRAASAESRRHFGDFTLNPRIELISKVLTKKYAPRFAGRNQKLVLWVEPYTPDDREERRADWEALAKHQSCSRDELRQGLLGLGPIKDGDTMAAPPTQQLVPVQPTREALPPQTTVINIPRQESTHYHTIEVASPPALTVEGDGS